MGEVKVAIFVDTENLLPWIRTGGLEKLLEEISSLGQAIVRRAYGKWTNHHLTTTPPKERAAQHQVSEP